MFKAWLLLLSILIFALFPVKIHAQDRYGKFIAFPARLGFSQGLNYHVCESRDGYLWIGTSNGLVKFDGKHYRRIAASQNTITDNLVVDVAESSDGNIWIAGFWNGCSRFDTKTQTFRRYPVIGYSGSDKQQVNKILALSTGQVWLGTGNMGLALYEPGIDSFLFFKPETAIVKNGKSPGIYTVRDIVQDPHNKTLLWLIIDGDIYQFSTKTYAFIKCEIKNREAFSNIFFTAIGHDGKHGLWLGTWGNGMNRYDLLTHKLEHLDYKDENGVSVKGLLALDVAQVDDTTVLWACSLSGLIQYNPVTGNFMNITALHENDSTGKEKRDFQSISITPHGGIFAGVSGYIYQLHPLYNRLSPTFFPSQATPALKVFISQVVSSADQSTTFLSCAGPVSLIQLNHADLSQKSIPVKHPTKVTGLKQIFWRTNDELLALGYDGLFYGLKPNEPVMKPLQLPQFTKSLFINCAPDGKGYMWVRNSGTLFRVRLSTLKVTDSIALPGSMRPTKYKEWPLYFYQMQTDSKGRVWLSSNQGLWMAEVGSRYPKRFAPGTPEGRWMRHDLIKTFLIDPDDKLWIGYNGDGMQLMDTRTLLPVEVFNHKAFPYPVINDFAITPKGLLLCATSEGLLSVDRDTFAWQMYGIEDGLLNQDIGSGLFVLPDGMVLVPHTDGYNVFHENALNIYHDNLKINITSLLINNQEFNLSSFQSGTSRLRLSYSHNNISLTFAAMQWQFPWRTKYSYRLFSGSDTTSWIPLDEPTLHLSAMKPGNYTLQFAALGAGNTLSWPKQILISIRPPFWQELWFIFLMNVTVILGIYGLYRFRLNHLRKPLEVRNTISRNLHDDIGSSLSNIQILTEMAKRNLGDPDKTRSLLEKSGEDLQRVSEALSDIVWNVSPQYDDLNNLFIRMKRYAADVLEGKQIACELQFPEDAPEYKMKMETRRDFYLIFKESIHNLVKYAQASLARVSVEVKNHQVHLTVSDNGTGFDATKIAAGNGLGNMRERAAKCGGNLIVQSEKGKGTTISCILPLN